MILQRTLFAPSPPAVILSESGLGSTNGTDCSEHQVGLTNKTTCPNEEANICQYDVIECAQCQYMLFIYKYQ